MQQEPESKKIQTCPVNTHNTNKTTSFTNWPASAVITGVN